MTEREMNICLSILPLYVPGTRGRAGLESRDIIVYLKLIFCFAQTLRKKSTIYAEHDYLFLLP